MPMPLALEPTVQSVGRPRFLVLRIASIYLLSPVSPSPLHLLGHNFLPRAPPGARHLNGIQCHPHRTHYSRSDGSLWPLPTRRPVLCAVSSCLFMLLPTCLCVSFLWRIPCVFPPK